MVIKGTIDCSVLRGCSAPDSSGSCWQRTLHSPRLSPTPERESIAGRYALGADAVQTQVGQRVASRPDVVQATAAGTMVTGRFLGSIPVGGAHLLGRMHRVADRGLWVTLATGIIETLDGLADLEMEALRLVDSYNRGESMGATPYDRVCNYGNTLLPAAAAFWGLAKFSAPSSTGRMPMPTNEMAFAFNRPAMAMAATSEVTLPKLSPGPTTGILMMAGRPYTYDDFLNEIKDPVRLEIFWFNSFADIERFNQNIKSCYLEVTVEHLQVFLDFARDNDKAHQIRHALLFLLQHNRQLFQSKALRIRTLIHTCMLDDAPFDELMKTPRRDLRPYLRDMVATGLYEKHDFRQQVDALFHMVPDKPETWTSAEVALLLEAAKKSEAVAKHLSTDWGPPITIFGPEHVPAILQVAKANNVSFRILRLIEERWEIIEPHWPAVEEFLRDYSTRHDLLTRAHELQPKTHPKPRPPRRR